MYNLKWKKVIIKDKFITEDGVEHPVQKVYIALANTETGERLISPFSDFLNEFAGKKTVTVSLAADIISRFLNYVIFQKNKEMETLTIQDGIDYLNSIAGTAQKSTQEEYARYITKFYAFLVKKGVLKAVPPEDLHYTCDKDGYEVLENPFKGRYITGSRNDTDLIHNIASEYLDAFIQTARNEVPDIALGIFLQCFGGLRQSEVIYLEYKNIKVKIVNGKKSIQLSLKDKDLREDLSTAFISACKKNRTQAVLPAFDDLLWELYEQHKEKYQREDCSAIFVDTNGRAMSGEVYYKRFCRLKRKFIERLRNSEDFDAKSYAIYLSSYKWSTHICRGIFSNIVAECTGNIMEIAAWRGDSDLSSALSYLTDGRQLDDTALRVLNEMFKPKEVS